MPGHKTPDTTANFNERRTRLPVSAHTLIRPAARNEPPRAHQRFLRPFRQIIESVCDTLKGQLSLERHNGRTPAGVAARVLTRILALTAAIWHNRTHHPDRPARSLTHYDH